MQIAFLGLGRMGAAMARHVLDAGHELTVWNRSPGRAGPLVEAGAREAPSVAEAVREAQAVVLMLFGPDSVREVLEEVTGAAGQGTLVVDGTTVGPRAAQEFAGIVQMAGLRYVDAPVAGSVQPATEGTLGVLVGCPEQDWDDVRPLLELWGDPAKIRRVGDVGAGSAVKLVVNQGIGVLASGLGETLALAGDLGLEQRAVLDVLAQGPYGWVLGQKRSMLEAGDYPPAFSLDLLVKDLDLAVQAADGDLPVTQAALRDCRAAQQAGRGGHDYATVIGYLAGG